MYRQINWTLITCMQCAASQLLLDKTSHLLRIALPFVCRCVSVFCRHHGLGQSSTRYSKCMTFSYTHPSFISEESNWILDGCRSTFLIKSGSGRVWTLSKMQMPNRPVCHYLFIWLIWVSILQPVSMQTFACLNMTYDSSSWYLIDVMRYSFTCSFQPVFCFVLDGFGWFETLLKSVCPPTRLQISLDLMQIVIYIFSSQL